MSRMLTPTSLRSYVRHAELYGGYESVFEEAAQDLNPLDLAHLCMAMRSMSHELHPLRSDGKRKIVTETFKLTPSVREALVGVLVREGVASNTITDLVGCSESYVHRIAQDQERKLETFHESHTEAPLRPCDSTGAVPKG